MGDSMKTIQAALLPAVLALASGVTEAQAPLEVGGTGANCNEDPHCINRLHPDIAMPIAAQPGQPIVFHARNASDFDLAPDAPPDPRAGGPYASTVHPLTGPVRIEGARAGDLLAVTIEDIRPGAWGYTSIGGIGFVSDHVQGPYRVLWRLGQEYAHTESIPGVRIPNRAFPGVVTVLPGAELHAAIQARETALAQAGGAVFGPEPAHATPDALCGPAGSQRDACLRTIPPREHGGNMDIRYLGEGATVYLPCFVDGCGLAIGDAHYAQGDGEVAGTAIEMDAVITVTTRVIPGAGLTVSGPRFEGPASLMDIPSERFYATTGLPLKPAGSVPPDLVYLDSQAAPGLENLSKDLGLAARNALIEMIDYMVETRGLTPQQAYIVASVAVDLRIGQLVDAPNVGVSAILPLDIFVEEPAGEEGNNP